MSGNPFAPQASQLPEELPVFPLPGAVLLPGGHLPLNIFEPRYLAMTLDALGESRLVGMIQPYGYGQDPGAGTLGPIGCAGRISAFAERPDGRLLVTLTGVCRFAPGQERPGRSGYRRVLADWQPYLGDLASDSFDAVARQTVIDTISRYCERSGIDVDWSGLSRASDAALVGHLTALCPFPGREKESVLAADTLDDRARALMTLAELAVLDSRETETSEPVGLGDLFPRGGQGA